MTTAPRSCAELAQTVLQQGASARTLSVALKHVAYSGDLMNQMKTHSEKMEKIYDSCQGLLSNPKTREDKFENKVNDITVLFEWFEKAEVRGLESCF